MNYNFNLKGQQVGIFEEKNGNLILKINVQKKNSSENLLVPVLISKEKWENHLNSGLNPDYLNISGELLSEWQPQPYSDRNALAYTLKANFLGNFETQLFSKMGGKCNFEGYATLIKRTNFDSSETQAKKLRGRRVTLKTENNTLFEAVAMRDRAEIFDSYEIGQKLFIQASLMAGNNNKPFPYFAVQNVSV